MATVDEKIAALISEAKQSPGKYQYISIGKVSNELADLIKDAIGKDVRGYALILDTFHVRHVLRRHPEIRMRDFLFLPAILRKPDSVKPGNKPHAIVVQKELVVEYTCVEVIVEDTRSLKLKTFWMKGRRLKNSNGGSEKSKPPRKA